MHVVDCYRCRVALRGQSVRFGVVPFSPGASKPFPVCLRSQLRLQRCIGVRRRADRCAELIPDGVPARVPKKDIV